MKKYFILAFALLFALSLPIPALAGGSLVNTASHDEISAGGYSSDNSFSRSWFGFGDDFGDAWGVSGGIATDSGEGRLLGWGKAYSRGEAFAAGCTDSYALALDFWPFADYSEAWAGADTTVSVAARGESGFKGFALGDAFNESNGKVEGDVHQITYAAEWKDGKTSAEAGGTSNAEFYGKTHDSDYGAGIFCGSVDSSISMTGNAAVDGHSVAYVDRYGDHQSAYAMTENSAQANVTGDDFELNKVSGNGFANVGAMAGNSNAGASAGGMSSFTYNGVNFGGIAGQGQAVMNADAGVSGGCGGGNCFNSSASGSAFSQTGN